MIEVVLSAARVGLAAYSGVDAVIQATLRFGFSLALKAHAKDREAADEMVDLIKARVPVDSGRLLNGITVREEGDAFVVEASAVRGSSTTLGRSSLATT